MPITTLPTLDRASATFKADVDLFFGTKLPAFSAEANALEANVNAKEASALASANIALPASVTATTKAAEALASANAASGALGYKNAAAVSATSAETAATAAQGFASLAQATNPDSPIRINTSKVSSAFTLASGYNGVSAGPIEITNNITVTISNFATWSII